MSGKALARAVRGHFLVDTALTAFILSLVYGIPVPIFESNPDDNGDKIIRNNDSTYDLHTSQIDIPEIRYPRELEDATDVLNLFLKGEVSLSDINNSDALSAIRTNIEHFRQSRSKCRTAKLWFQYMDMICILRDFIKAERTGNWNMHLESLKSMLSYFAASGHNLYVKSAWKYINQMEHLKEQKTEAAAFFETGYHVIRRTDTFWAGISSDLAIEQALMRSIKTTGGLTRGRGMSESQRALWILSRPDCAEMNDAMQTFTGINYYSSDQHKEDGKSRQKHDTKDTMIFASFLEERSPFINAENLRNIETGVSATMDVNVDNAKQVGDRILSSMESKSIRVFVQKKIPSSHFTGQTDNR